MIVLSGCSTGLASRQYNIPPSEQDGQHLKDGPEGEPVLASLAVEPCQRGHTAGASDAGPDHRRLRHPADLSHVPASRTRRHP